MYVIFLSLPGLERQESTKVRVRCRGFFGFVSTTRRFEDGELKNYFFSKFKIFQDKTAKKYSNPVLGQVFFSEALNFVVIFF